MLPDSTAFVLACTFLHSLTDLSFVLGRGGAVSSSVITFAFGFGFHFAALVFLLFRTTEVDAVHDRIANLFVICHKDVDLSGWTGVADWGEAGRINGGTGGCR